MSVANQSPHVTTQIRRAIPRDGSRNIGSVSLLGIQQVGWSSESGWIRVTCRLLISWTNLSWRMDGELQNIQCWGPGSVAAASNRTDRSTIGATILGLCKSWEKLQAEARTIKDYQGLSRTTLTETVRFSFPETLLEAGSSWRTSPKAGSRSCASHPSRLAIAP